MENFSRYLEGNREYRDLELEINFDHYHEYQSEYLDDDGDIQIYPDNIHALWLEFDFIYPSWEIKCMGKALLDNIDITDPLPATISRIPDGIYYITRYGIKTMHATHENEFANIEWILRRAEGKIEIRNNKIVSLTPFHTLFAEHRVEEYLAHERYSNEQRDNSLNPHID